MSERVVAKFGGTSMAQPELVAGIVEGSPETRIIVPSAPGGDAQYARMTPTLEHYAGLVRADNSAASGLRDEIIDRYNSLYSPLLGSQELSALNDQAAKLLNPSEIQTIAYYKSRGELLSARYLARVMGGIVLAPQIYFTPKGKLQRDPTGAAIRQQIGAADNSMRIFIPGFYGVDHRKQIHLLGHGGSDRTGALYGAALGWDYENWTDVDGIYSADPRVVPNARLLEEVTRREVREGAHGGSGVLQGDTIADLDDSSVVVTVKNTNNPRAAGTRVVPALQAERDRDVIAISGRDDLTVINVDDMGMRDSVGYSAAIFDKMRELDLSYANSPTTEDFASFTIHTSEENAGKIEDLKAFAEAHLLSRTGRVSSERLGVVTLVGEALRSRRVNARTVQRTIGNAGLNKVEVVPIPGLESPSSSFLVTLDENHEAQKKAGEPTAIDRLVRAVHAYEIEGKRIL